MMREPEDEESVLQLCSMRDPEDFRMNDPAPAESAGGLRLTLASLTDSDSHLQYSVLCDTPAVSRRVRVRLKS